MACSFCHEEGHNSIQCWNKNKNFLLRFETRVNNQNKTIKRIYKPIRHSERQDRTDLRKKLEDKQKDEPKNERTVTYKNRSRTPSPKRKEIWPPLETENKLKPEEEIVILKERSTKHKKSPLSLPLPIQDVESTPEYQELKAQNSKLKKELDIARNRQYKAIVERDEYKRILDFHMRRLYSTPSQNTAPSN